MHCLHPISVKNKYYGLVGHPYYDMMYLSVPCGKCINCQQNRRSAWVARNRYENNHCISSCFVTLTISEESIVYGYCAPTLDYSMLQNFWKRLRKRYGKGIKYFSCGEYGSHSGRPHFHALIYNLPLLHNGKDFYEWYRKKLQDIWPFGFLSLAPVNDNRLGYITKYIIKDDNDKRMFAEFGIEPPRLFLSRGIGDGLEKNITGEFRFISQFGSISKIPRRFLEKLKRDDLQAYYKVISERRKHFDAVAENEFKRFGGKVFESRNQWLNRLALEEIQSRKLYKRSKKQIL